MKKELIVQVESEEQWNTVVQKWLDEGYRWRSGREGLLTYLFYSGSRQLTLGDTPDLTDKEITYSRMNLAEKSATISFKKFMKKGKKKSKKKIYEVNAKQNSLINDVIRNPYPADQLFGRGNDFLSAFALYSKVEGEDLLKYIGGDESIEFVHNPELDKEMQ